MMILQHFALQLHSFERCQKKALHVRLGLNIGQSRARGGIAGWNVAELLQGEEVLWLGRGFLLRQKLSRARFASDVLPGGRAASLLLLFGLLLLCNLTLTLLLDPFQLPSVLDEVSNGLGLAGLSSIAMGAITTHVVRDDGRLLAGDLWLESGIVRLAELCNLFGAGAVALHAALVEGQEVTAEVVLHFTGRWCVALPGEHDFTGALRVLLHGSTKSVVFGQRRKVVVERRLANLGAVDEWVVAGAGLSDDDVAISSDLSHVGEEGGLLESFPFRDAQQ